MKLMALFAPFAATLVLQLTERKRKGGVGNKINLFLTPTLTSYSMLTPCIVDPA